MKTRNHYTCFISSPGDCSEERLICEKVINEINGGLSKHLNVNFETFMWEYDVLPDMGINGQELIDEYAKKSNYDIFIGIMKNKFGHPTKKAGSGTVHEFNDAIERKGKENNIPKIIFFFGKENVDIDNPNMEEIMSQRKQVIEFKQKIQHEGIYVDFNVDNFEEKLKQNLELFIKEKSPFEKPAEKIEKIDIVTEKLELDLKESLKIYNEDTPVWIEPIVSSHKEIPNNPAKNSENRIELSQFIDNPSDSIIKAPSEFGMTSLAHYLKLQAWKKGLPFLYIDSRKTKKHKVVKDIKNIYETYFIEDISNVKCILLDSVNFEEQGIMPMIKNICEAYPEVPLIIFNTLENSFFLKSDEDDKVEIKRHFKPYYLLPLPQNALRKIVTTYSSTKSLEGDCEKTLHKVTKDLEVLNMHRTVKNCISILRASSKIGNDYNAVNRTMLLETILASIFQDYELPTYYDKKPDVKDCSYVLGYLCELLIIRKDFDFTDDFFKENLTKFCDENFIELELNYLLTVLKDNGIISKKDNVHNFFKNSYWVFYFIAQRMNMNDEFRAKIYKDQNYIDYPEIIEFYTGIDRNKGDALKILLQDLNDTLDIVRTKVNIPDELNPYQAISWTPDIKSLEKEEAKIGENVISSGLPDEVKDKYDDNYYDQVRPYNQIINSVIRDYSFLVLMRQITAASRALRNSDFVQNTQLKVDLLNLIISGWHEMNKLLIVISPLLADKGDVAFEGANFHLEEDDFNIDDPVQKRNAVLLAVPTNIVRIFKDDLFSMKMGPLLIGKALTEKNSLLKHQLMLLILAERPKKWRETVDNYIINLDKNSYFLSDLLSVINFNIDYKATEITDVQILKMLGKKCRAKHIFKNNNPNQGLINRLDKLDRGSKF